MSKSLIISNNEVQELEFEEVLCMYKALIMNEIYNFSNLKETYDDKYQMASIALWNAYDKYNVELRIGFGLLAKIYIRSKFKTEIERQKRFKRTNFITVSIDNTIETDDDEFGSILQLIPSNQNVERYVVTKILLELFMMELNYKEKETLDLYINGQSYNSISEILDSKPSTIRMRIGSIRKKLTKFIL